MGMLQSLVDDVENAVQSGDQEHRTAILRKVTDMFVSDAPKLSETHVGVFDEVIMRLSQEIEFRARVDLSEKMAGIHNAPRRVIRQLAMDEDVRVAGPVLERSTRLDESDLLNIAKERGQDHLLAISARRGLSERVTDILVERGNNAVVRSVASNLTARFSDRGYRNMTMKAQSDPRLNNILSKRDDVPAHIMEALLEVAKQHAKEKLCGENEVDDAHIDAALEDSISQITKAQATLAFIADDEEIKVRVRKLAGNTPPDETLLVDFLKHNQIPEAAAAMAEMAKVSMDIVAKAYSSRHYDPILIIVRAAKISWPTFKMILEIKTGKVLSEHVLKRAFESYEKLSPATAQRVLRFMVIRNTAA